MSRSKKIKIIISIVCISFIQGLQFCVSPVLGQIQEHYSNVDVSMIQMLITAPALLSMVVSVACGWLVLKIDKKKLLIFAGMTAGVTGFLPFLADSFWLLFVARAAYGVAMGLATTLNVAVVAEFFEGDERVSVMGIQAASVGAGMVVVTTIGGILGTRGFQNAYFINGIGFIAMPLIAVCLPQTGTAKEKDGGSEKIRLNQKVFLTSFFGMLEFLFLITFTTNIAMHISGDLAGSTTVSGNLTGVFSGAQIVMGMILGIVARLTKRYTLPAAMLSFSVGGILLILFPSNLALLMTGAVFCGFSQGMFIPTAMVEVSNAVTASSTAMASACFSCAMCLGQLISPTILNTIAQIVFGETTTTNVYITAVIGMTAAALLAAVWKSQKTADKNNKK